jgi:tetratricopeptide (TPR) repeat protein
MSATEAPASLPELLDSTQYSKAIDNELRLRKGIEENATRQTYTSWLRALKKLHPAERSAAIESVAQLVGGRDSAAVAYLERAQGQLLADQGRLAEAEPHFRRMIVLRAGKTDFGSWLQALDKLDPASQQKAEEEVKQAIGNTRESASAHLRWAKSLSDLKKQDQAEEQFEIANKLAPDDPDILSSWGDFFHAQNKFGEAEKRWRKAVERGADADSDVFDSWLNVLDKLPLAQRQAASRSLEELIENGAHRLEICLGLAKALKKKGRFEEASARYEQATKIKPESKSGWASCYVSWGALLASQREHGRAIEKFRRAAELSPNTAADAYLKWGNSLKALGEYGEAGSKYAQSTALRTESMQAPDPTESEDLMETSDPTEAYKQWGQLLYMVGQHDEAARTFQRAIIAAASDRSGYFLQWLHNVARVPSALQVTLASELAEAIDRNEDLETRADVYVEWGSSLSQRGKHPDAIQKYQRALELNPKNHGACIAWGDTLAAQKKFVGATEQYKRAGELGYDAKSTEYKLATVLLAQGKYQAAKEALLALQPNEDLSANVHDPLGDCCYALHQFDEAEYHFRQSLTQDTSWNSLNKWRSAFQKLAPVAQPEAFEAADKARSRDTAALTPWAWSFYYLGRVDEALAQFEDAVTDSPDDANVHFDYGNFLVAQRRYDEALAEFRKSIDADENYVYPYHNIASTLGDNGKYPEARVAWENARRCYDRYLPIAVADSNPYPFYYFGQVLSEIHGELDAAQSALQEGLEIDPRNVEILIFLGQVWLNRAAEGLCDSATAEVSAGECFRKAEAILRDQRDDSNTWALWGDLLLKMKRFDEAEKYLRKIADADSLDPGYTQLGVLFSQKKDLKKATEYFEKAVRATPDDLDARSKLAESLMNLKSLDRTQTEYEKILKIAPEHIDTRLGLGQLFTKLGDAGDVDMYDVAVTHLAEAIRLAESMTGSRRVSRTDLAASYYSLGYARVRLYEKSKTLGEESQLAEALSNFSSCTKLDGSHYKARRAVEKLTKRIKLLSPQSLIEKTGPWIIFVASVLVFFFTQAGFWLQWPSWLNHQIQATLYSAMTLSSLALAIVGLYLPRILKLKVAGIEIEKSSVEQISTTSQPLNIGM